MNERNRTLRRCGPRQTPTNNRNGNGDGNEHEKESSEDSTGDGIELRGGEPARAGKPQGAEQPYADVSGGSPKVQRKRSRKGASADCAGRPNQGCESHRRPPAVGERGAGDPKKLEVRAGQQ